MRHRHFRGARMRDPGVTEEAVGVAGLHDALTKINPPGSAH